MLPPGKDIKGTRIRKIRTYMTSWEAEQARNYLEAQGIKAFVEGVNAQVTLSYAGGAMSGVKLLVAEKDAKLAEQLLLEEAPDSVAWTCRRCYSEVDAGFDVCWKCGLERNQEFQTATGDSSKLEENDQRGVDDPAARGGGSSPQQSRGAPSTSESRSSPGVSWVASNWILVFAVIELLALIVLVLLQSRK